MGKCAGKSGYWWQEPRFCRYFPISWVTSIIFLWDDNSEMCAIGHAATLQKTLQFFLTFLNHLSPAWKDTHNRCSSKFLMLSQRTLRYIEHFCGLGRPMAHHMAPHSSRCQLSGELATGTLERGSTRPGRPGTTNKRPGRIIGATKPVKGPAVRGKNRADPMVFWHVIPSLAMLSLSFGQGPTSEVQVSTRETMGSQGPTWVDRFGELYSQCQQTRVHRNNNGLLVGIPVSPSISLINCYYPSLTFLGRHSPWSTSTRNWNRYHALSTLTKTDRFQSWLVMVYHDSQLFAPTLVDHYLPSLSCDGP